MIHGALDYGGLCRGVQDGGGMINELFYLQTTSNGEGQIYLTCDSQYIKLK
jgi:hypothetical protein